MNPDSVWLYVGAVKYGFRWFWPVLHGFSLCASMSCPRDHNFIPLPKSRGILWVLGIHFRP